MLVSIRVGFDYLTEHDASPRQCISAMDGEYFSGLNYPFLHLVNALSAEFWFVGCSFCILRMKVGSPLLSAYLNVLAAGCNNLTDSSF
jgi:hypothetical protein